MSVITKILEVWSISKTFSAASALLMKLIAGVAVIILCVVIASILFAALVIGAILVAYRQLVLSGMDPQLSALLVGAGIAAILLIVILIAKKRISDIKQASRNLSNFRAPGTDGVMKLIDAFLEGFEQTHHTKEQTHHTKP